MKKKVLFALIALVSFVTSWAALPPGDGPQQEQVTGATLTTTKVVYNGSATLAPAISKVTLSTGAQSQKDYKFYAVTEATNDAPSFTKDGAPEERGASKVPTHVGFWYAWFHEGPNKFGVKFEVEKATLKIDLLQISKYVGENDPNLTFETIGEWAQITGWGEGDDITNTTINGIQFKRVDVGEDAYAEDGSQKQYTYTLEEGLTATTTILGTAYENYNVGIGQSSKLLINKSILYVAVKDWCQSKTFGENDPDFNTARSYTLSAKATEDATANIVFVIPEGTTFRISRATGDNAGQYAFQANPEIYRNYEKVIFTPANFTINPKPIDIAGATFSESYVYEGKDLEPKPTEVWYMNGTEKVNLGTSDYTVTYSTNYRRDVTGTNQNFWPTATVTPKGNYKLKSANSAKTVKFQITKAPLKFAIGDNYKVLGEDDPNPLTTLDFDYLANKGLRGTDKTDAFAASVASQVLTREAGEDFGQYAITVKENATLTNYSIESSTPGTFYIIRGENTIVVNIGNATITYEDEYDLTKLVSVELPENFQGNESVGDDLYEYVITQVTKGQRQNNNELVEVTTDNVGSYIVYIKNGPEVMGNYRVLYLKGNLTINRLNLYIQPDKVTKVYGDDDPAMTAWSLYKITGYTRTGEPIYTKYTKEVDVPQANYLGGTSRFDYRIQREDGENVRKYTTYFAPRRTSILSGNTQSYGTRSEGNYTFQTINGEFEITKADLTIKVSGTSKTYGDPDPTTGFRAIAGSNNTKFENNHIAIEIEGAKRREARSIAELVAYGSRSNNVITYRTAGEDAGAYDIKNINAPISGNGHNTIFDNYTVKFNEDKSDDKFTINPRHLKVKANDQSIKYGTEIDPYDLTVVGGNYEYSDNELSGDLAKKDIILTKLGNLVEDTYEDVFKPLTTEYTQAGKVFENAFSEIELTDAAKNNYVIDSYDNGYLYIEQADVLYLDMKDLAQALNDHRGRTVEVRLCGAPVKEEGCDPFRQFVAYQWNTLVLPFTAMPREISEAFRYAVIDTLNVGNKVENSFSLAIRTRRIDANTPFIIQTDKSWRYDAAPEAEANPELITFGQRKIADFDYLNDVPTAEDAAGNKIIGTYKPKSDFTAANYIMRRNSGAFFRFVPSAEDPNPSYDMIQTEAYLQAAKADGPVRVFIDEEDGSTTAIEFVDADAEVAAEAAEGWYTVTGVKLDGEPTVSGTYIFNGKKVFFQAK